MFVNSLNAVPAGAIETVTGRYIDVMEPDPAVVEAYDIFWALSRQARFSGHTLSEEIWSVGQHSLFVVEIVQQLMYEMLNGKDEITKIFDNFCLETGSYEICDLQKKVVDNRPKHLIELFTLDVLHYALLHDATEAYLVDLPSPIKQHSALKDVYKSMESKLNTTIMEKFNIPEDDLVMNRIVRWADMFALQVEASNMMPSRGKGWGAMSSQFSPMTMHKMPKVLPWKDVFAKLMKSHDEFLTKRKSLWFQL